MATKKQDEKQELVAQAAKDAQDPAVGDLAESLAAKALPPEERLVEDITTNPLDADITATTGTLTGPYVGEPQSGTVERTPIVGQPEVVVVDGLPADAPRFGPHWERERAEKDAAAKAKK